MDFGYDARTEELRGQLLAFMDAFVYPAEKVFADQVAEAAAAGQIWQRPRSLTSSRPRRAAAACGTCS